MLASGEDDENAQFSVQAYCCIVKTCPCALYGLYCLAVLRLGPSNQNLLRTELALQRGIEVCHLVSCLLPLLPDLPSDICASEQKLGASRQSKAMPTRPCRAQYPKLFPSHLLLTANTPMSVFGMPSVSTEASELPACRCMVASPLDCYDVRLLQGCF
jgi:hypothetical protein